jgi:hypothetical protein
MTISWRNTVVNSDNDNELEEYCSKFWQYQRSRKESMRESLKEKSVRSKEAREEMLVLSKYLIPPPSPPPTVFVNA